jgi:SAM-dependent methyltransferase
MTSGYHDDVAQHYEKFPYPAYPIFSLGAWKSLESVDCQTWGAKREVRDIWVAGCGTIAPLMFARKNFRSNILASDISVRTLNICARRLWLFGMRNVRLQWEDILQVNHRECFDAVDAYGVIHHTISPQVVLEKLTDSLRSGGVMRFMVYSNHARGEIDKVRQELRAMNITAVTEAISHLERQNIQRKGDLSTDVGIADALINPIAHVFTRSTLDSLLAAVPLLHVLEIREHGNFVVFARKL